MTARAQQPRTSLTLAPPTAALRAANADLLHNGPRLSHVGRYQLQDCLSDDVHGSVYEAWDPLLSRNVAVKTLQFGLKMSARIAVDRQLLRAARAASELSHRGIAAVYDAGLSAHGVYVAMERLSGQDLERALYEGWQPDIAEILKLARRIAAALAFAHSRGVVHGGLEPASIFLTRMGRPKLLNFGLVDALREAEVAELADVHLGSLGYRAPEQLVGGNALPQSDVFSLGAVLYELLTGRRAFNDDTPEGLLRAILKGPATPLATLRPDLSTPLVLMVQAALAFEPGARPATATAMAAALRDLAQGHESPAAQGGSGVRSLMAPQPRLSMWQALSLQLNRWLGVERSTPVFANSLSAHRGMLASPKKTMPAALPSAHGSEARQA